MFETLLGMAETVKCDVYWDSHGCELERGHNGLHRCDCCDCPNHVAGKADAADTEWVCAATWPYYGPETLFYGGDVNLSA